MKRLLYTLILLFQLTFVFAQKKAVNLTIDKDGNPIRYAMFAYLNGDKCQISLALDEKTKWISAFNVLPYQETISYNFLEGTEVITLTTRIHKDSLNFYRYSIIDENGAYLVDNANPKKATFSYPERSDFPNYLELELAKLNVIGKKITVQMYHLSERSKIYTAVIYNKPIKAPAISFVDVHFNQLNAKKYTKPNRLSNEQIIIKDEKIVALNIGIENTELAELYDVALFKKTGDGFEKVYQTNILYRNKQYSAVIENAYLRDMGEYYIQILSRIRPGNGIEPHLKPQSKTTFKFSIEDHDAKVFTISEIVIFGVVAAAVFGAIFGASMVYLRKKARQNLSVEQQQKEIAKSRLDNVRLQLNPHFMFNALAGIQSLMNEQKTAEANQYLGKFARITRNVLANKELISLAEEKTLLDDYLQMEQLRFGFNYEMDIKPDVDLNIEIPSMLLQPLVENAVKHGIAGEGKRGKIIISFTRIDEDLILQIKDNGKGFDTSKTYVGYGLQLSKNRVKLLNSMYKENELFLAINADANGTVVKVTLKEWL
ncbi:MAG TPA: histidine kinase [Pedobacter sp.]|nr:histidine kinase [Pedobacter sp.]